MQRGQVWLWEVAVVVSLLLRSLWKCLLAIFILYLFLRNGSTTFIIALVGICANVASDALANLASSGVNGGALVIVGEDYGEGSSIMQERSHAFAMKSQMWLLDPRPNLPHAGLAKPPGKSSR